MHDFVSHILRQYFLATGWNEYNSYLHLTSSSSAILDFPVPTGLSLSISASPTPPFFTTYRLGALPNLRAGIGYIYASTKDPIDFGKSSRDVRLKEIIERFRIVQPTRANVSVRGKKGEDEGEYYWLAGEKFPELTQPDKKKKEEEEEGGEYLIYGCMHVPSARLDALFTRRLTPTTQLIVTAVSTPPKYPLSAIQNAASYASSTTAAKTSSLAGSTEKLDASTQLSSSTPNLSSPAGPASDLGPPGSTNLQLTLQRDTGKWFTEYSYSVDDALWGFRVLHNFGYSSSHADPIPATEVAAQQKAMGTMTAEDTDAGGGLRGRFSAGAEVFVSTVEKSAGLSTGIRFSTLPDSPPIIHPSSSSSFSSATTTTATTSEDTTPTQPPTVITATLNPMMGHLSTAYAARMARDVVVSSRFDFNVYSYESEWSVGGEYWLRGSPTGLQQKGEEGEPMGKVGRMGWGEKEPVKASSALSLRDTPQLAMEDSQSTTTKAGGSLSLRPPTETDNSLPAPAELAAVPSPSSLNSPAPTTTAAPQSVIPNILSPITGVLKARLSTTSDIRLLWQGRLSNCLLSLGVKADLSSTSLSPSPHTTSNTSLHAGSHGKMGIVKSIGLEVMYFSQAQNLD